jgi:hypothetical protein
LPALSLREIDPDWTKGNEVIAKAVIKIDDLLVIRSIVRRRFKYTPRQRPGLSHIGLLDLLQHLRVDPNFDDRDSISADFPPQDTQHVVEIWGRIVEQQGSYHQIT